MRHLTTSVEARSFRLGKDSIELPLISGSIARFSRKTQTTLRPRIRAQILMGSGLRAGPGRARRSGP